MKSIRHSTNKLYYRYLDYQMTYDYTIHIDGVRRVDVHLWHPVEEFRDVTTGADVMQRAARVEHHEALRRVRRVRRTRVAAQRQRAGAHARHTERRYLNMDA